MLIPMASKSPEQRFLKLMVKSKGCWLWRGAVAGKYGSFWYNGRSVPAHRMSMYMWEDYELDNPSVVHHKCANRLCVNPAHLQITDHDNNLAEMMGRRQYMLTIQRLQRDIEDLQEELRNIREQK
jgi:hypothetical protein